MKTIGFYTLCVVVLVGSLVIAPVRSSRSKGLLREGEVAARKRIVETYDGLPLAFEANEGQTESRVKFVTHAGGSTMLLGSDDVVLTLNTAHSRSSSSAPRNFATASARQQRTAALRLRMVDANPVPGVDGLEELPGKSNYFIGQDPEKWRTNVHNYAKVRYTDVYPGIDLVYYGNHRSLEYDLIVAPNADPKKIHFAIEGAEKLRLDPQGDLSIEVEGEQVHLHKPLAYQEMGGSRHRIEASYVLEDKTQVRFAIGAYDGGKPLIIDPVLVYATYLGGSGTDFALGIAVDSSSNVYVSGVTSSGNFPTTAGSLQTSYRGFPQAVFVAKLNPAGSSLLYSTYMSGRGQHDFLLIGNVIAVDREGNAYVTGETDSDDFPTTEQAIQRSFAGGDSDSFVAKLNPTGSALTYSTYLGGRSADAVLGVAVDAAQNAYICGITNSKNFPTTTGAFQTTSPGGFDAFVTKLNASGSAFVYSTFLGGDSDEGSEAIAVDNSGNAYVAGAGHSSDFPTTPGALQTSFSGGQGDDVFVTKLNAAGTALIYSTYLGGSGNEAVFGMALDALGNIYVTGGTRSSNFPTTAGAFQTSLSGTTDAFVTKLNAGGSALFYSTYLGGSGSDLGVSVAVDASGAAYVAGETESNNFPVTPDALQSNLRGSSDVFVTKVNAAGNALVYSSYLGGNGSEAVYGIAVDPSGDMYIAGGTASNDFPATRGAVQTSLREGFDAFIVRLSLAAPASLTISSGDGQSGPASRQVTIAVKIAGAGGVPLAGVTVNFSVASGSAQLSATAVQTALDGTASVQVTLGPALGPVRILAASAGLTSVSFNLTVTAPPVVTAVPSIDAGGVAGAALSIPAVRALSTGGIASVFGKNFGGGATFQKVAISDLVNGNVPTNFRGICVDLGGTRAPVFGASDTQVNFQVTPLTGGTVAVRVIVACGTATEVASNAMTVAVQPATPEFFYFASKTDGHNPVAATDSITSAGIAAADLYPGSGFAPAHSKQYLTVYATGFGTTSPAYAAGDFPTQLAAVAGGARVFLNGRELPAANVLYAGVTPFSPGLYQLNLLLPDDTPDGDLSLVIEIAGVPSPAGAYLTVKN